MPVSPLQHRTSNGFYQNKRYENVKGNTAKQARDINSGSSILSNEIQRFGNSIIDVYPADNVLIRSSNQTTKPRKDIAILLLMLLSQIRSVDNPTSAAGHILVSSNNSQFPGSGRIDLPDNSHYLSSDFWPFIPHTLARVGAFMLQHDPFRFPEASALSVENDLGRINGPAIKRPPRYALFKDKTTTPSPVLDDVKIEKLDLSCVEERQSLSITDVFRKIGQTLTNPVNELAKESQVISYYNNYHRCPTPEEIKKLEFITSKIDSVLSIVTSLIPGAHPLVITQRLGGPLFKMLADSIEGNEINSGYLFESNDQILALIKGIVDFSSKNAKGQVIESELRVPDGLSFKNNEIVVNIKGEDKRLIYENGNYFIHVNGKYRKVSYSPEKKEWERIHGVVETPGAHIYFSHKIVDKLTGSIDIKTLASIDLYQHAIYRVTSKKSDVPFYAVKIGDNFYHYIPKSEGNVSLNGVIKTDNLDINVSQFDKTYFPINEKNKLFVNYSPCRLGRTPGSSCIHLSEGVLTKLKMSKKNGLRAHQIRGLKPSQTQPGLYESIEGEHYIKYDNVYFKLTEIKNDLTEPKLVVTGEGFFGKKKITPVCFSREKGRNYINTPQENIMENTGMSKLAAISHIEHAQRMQSATVEPGSIRDTDYLDEMFLAEMVSPKIDISKLSAPDHQGVRTYFDGHQYIETSQGYLRLEKNKELHFISMDNGDKVYVEYVNNKFEPKRINRYVGIVSSAPYEMVNDLKINSPDGLDILKQKDLNVAWSLKKLNIKNINFNKDGSVGSNIAITFTMQYNKQKGNKYIEIPSLQWKERISFQEGDSKWHFETDMYKHNTNSMTFLPWRIRYVEAYNFAKAENKNTFNGNVRIYKKNMNPVAEWDIKNAITEGEKVKVIQKFLARNGGVMEITITDIPQLLKREITKTKERKLIFDIGFNNKVEAHFTQGIFLNAGEDTKVFVTTSDNVNLVKGEANVQPPERVTTPREYHPMQGEVY